MIKMDSDVAKVWLRYNQRLRRLVLGPNYVGPISEVKKQLLRQLGLEIEEILVKKKWPTFGDLKPKKFMLFGDQEKRASELIEAVRVTVPTPTLPINPDVIQADFLAGYEYGEGIWVGKNSFVDPSVWIVPPVVISKDCYVGPEVILGWMALRRMVIKPEQEKRLERQTPTVILKALVGFGH